MKLKFRADPEDWMIFGVFAVVLLYVIAMVSDTDFDIFTPLSLLSN